MSKERKIHEWIEAQDREEKDRVWAKIKKAEEERLAAKRAAEALTKQEQPKAEYKPAMKPFPWKRWAAVATSCVVIIGGALVAAQFIPKDIGPSNSSSSGGRYFNAQSYDSIETEITLKEYAQEIGVNLLYFDWYGQTDHIKDYKWQVKDTQETICFQEEIVDINTGSIVNIHVVEKDTEIDTLSADELTENVTQKNNINIYWKSNIEEAYANFVYEDYRYYLRVLDPYQETYILDLVEELLS